MENEWSITSARVAQYERWLQATTNQQHTEAQEMLLRLNQLTWYLAQVQLHLQPQMWHLHAAHETPTDERVLYELAGIFQVVVRLAGMFDWSLEDLFQASERAVQQRLQTLAQREQP